MEKNIEKSNLAFWAYLAAFLGVFGHATSEFFSVFSGLKGPEVSVWRFTVGGAALLVVGMLRKMKIHQTGLELGKSESI